MKVDLNVLDTETINENTVNIDTMNTKDILTTINSTDMLLFNKIITKKEVFKHFLYQFTLNFQ